jgi:hypothetical protein
MITLEILQNCLQRTHLASDKSGEEHYNMISALHKSMRGSDVDASLVIHTFLRNPIKSLLVLVGKNVGKWPRSVVCSEKID